MRRPATANCRLRARTCGNFARKSTRSSSLPDDVREKRVARDGASEEALDHGPGRLLAAAAEDHFAEAAAGLAVHEIRAEGGQEIERDHFRPHIAVIAGRVADRKSTRLNSS